MRKLICGFVLLAFGLAGKAFGAGTLTPVGSSHRPIQIRDHRVRVVVNNGFARTEVEQVFFNPNAVDLEAVYSVPVPKSGSLSEFSIAIGEMTMQGEVVEKSRAESIYEEERKRGNDAGLASKNGYQTYEFAIARVAAQSEVTGRFVYYQPCSIDTGVGRYLYALEDGGTDEQAKRFWFRNEKVEGAFSIDLELRSAWPVIDVRVPGFDRVAQVDRISDEHYRVHVERRDADLASDFVLYYRLADDLPGRVELIPFRDDPGEPGTFMLVVTPGIDLKPITGGSDFVFLLDVSGSMAGKMSMLQDGVARAIESLRPGDRFRVVTFNDRARELTSWLEVGEDDVGAAIAAVGSLRASNGTNMYSGVELATDDLDDERATSVVLITDAVANVGVVEPRAFAELLSAYDVRIYGFLLGNNANWPLMRLVTETTGGFSTGVSNADDIVGQVMLAGSKIGYEVLHDVELELEGVGASQVTGLSPRRVHRGEQLILFGRYDRPGTARLALRAHLTGEDKVYRTQFEMPMLAEDHPEIERLWALSRIEELEDLDNLGLLEGDLEASVVSLGVGFQLVTDYTSMIVLDDAAHQRHGIERANRDRSARERVAQSRRAQAPPRSYRVDGGAPLESAGDGRRPGMFPAKAPSAGGGSGAVDPITGIAIVCAGLAALAAGRREEADS